MSSEVPNLMEAETLGRGAHSSKRMETLWILSSFESVTVWTFCGANVHLL